MTGRSVLSCQHHNPGLLREMRLRRRSSAAKQQIGFASAESLTDAQKQVAPAIPDHGPQLELSPAPPEAASPPEKPAGAAVGNTSCIFDSSCQSTSMGGGTTAHPPAVMPVNGTAIQPSGAVASTSTKDRARSFAVKLREGFNPACLLGLKSKVNARQLLAAESASVYSSAATRYAAHILTSPHFSSSSRHSTC